jgi:hypothetical protein
MLRLEQANILVRARRTERALAGRMAVRAALIAKHAKQASQADSREVASHVLRRELAGFGYGILPTVPLHPTLTYRVYGTLGGHLAVTPHLVDKRPGKVYRNNGLGDLLQVMSDVDSALEHAPVTNLDILLAASETASRELEVIPVCE